VARKDYKMVIELIASKEFNWRPDIIKADDESLFIPSYIVFTEAGITPINLNSAFADLPSCGMWGDLKESDDALLDRLGGDWSGFGSEQ